MDEPIARDREAALALLHAYVESEALRRHALAVEASVRAYARAAGEDEQAWGCVALLHDFDWEIHPTLDRHPQEGTAILLDRGYPTWFTRAILSHARHTGVVPTSELERTLFACDELSGFVHACALVRPTGLEGLEPKSVRKKLKQASFAAGVDRDDVVLGAELIDLPLDDHIRNVVAALRPIASDLGLPSPT
jgi:predicted hydrolase (HD superfamily)